MEGWKDCTIGELGKIVGGATPSTKDEDNYLHGKIPWITPKDLSLLDGRYISRGERNITTKGLMSCSAQLMPANSILFSSRAPIGYVAIAANELCTNQGFKSIVPNDKTDYLFLYYLLKHYKDIIEGYGNGTTFREVSGSTMRGIKVKVPLEKAEQMKIGRLLSAIDDKIEANAVINDNLQQQLRAIFQSWFVDFDHSSSFIQNYQFGTIPDDFSVVRIEELPLLVTDYVANGSFADLKANVTLLSVPDYAYFIRNTDLKSGTFGVYVDKRSYDFLSKSVLYGGEIIISNVGDVGSVHLCPVLDKPMTLGNNIILLRTENRLLSHYLYVWFKWFTGQALIQGIKGGSAQPKFNKTDFRHLPVLLPNERLLGLFDDIATPMFETISDNVAENGRLTTLRDALLPKLMSGEIDASEVEI